MIVVGFPAASDISPIRRLRRGIGGRPVRRNDRGGVTAPVDRLARFHRQGPVARRNNLGGLRPDQRFPFHGLRRGFWTPWLRASDCDTSWINFLPLNRDENERW
jgi:hypothetical protein